MNFADFFLWIQKPQQKTEHAVFFAEMAFVLSHMPIFPIKPQNFHFFIIFFEMQFLLFCSGLSASNGTDYEPMDSFVFLWPKFLYSTTKKAFNNKKIAGYTVETHIDLSNVLTTAFNKIKLNNSSDPIDTSKIYTESLQKITKFPNFINASTSDEFQQTNFTLPNITIDAPLDYQNYLKEVVALFKDNKNGKLIGFVCPSLIFLILLVINIFFHFACCCFACCGHPIKKEPPKIYQMIFFYLGILCLFVASIIFFYIGKPLLAAKTNFFKLDSTIQTFVHDVKNRTGNIEESINENLVVPISLTLENLSYNYNKSVTSHKTLMMGDFAYVKSNLTEAPSIYPLFDENSDLNKQIKELQTKLTAAGVTSPKLEDIITKSTESKNNVSSSLDTVKTSLSGTEEKLIKPYIERKDEYSKFLDYSPVLEPIYEFCQANSNTTVESILGFGLSGLKNTFWTVLVSFLFYATLLLFMIGLYIFAFHGLLFGLFCTRFNCIFPWLSIFLVFAVGVASTMLSTALVSTNNQLFDATADLVKSIGGLFAGNLILYPEYSLLIQTYYSNLSYRIPQTNFNFEEWTPSNFIFANKNESLIEFFNASSMIPYKYLKGVYGEGKLITALHNLYAALLSLQVKEAIGTNMEFITNIDSAVSLPSFINYTDTISQIRTQLESKTEQNAKDALAMLNALAPQIEGNITERFAKMKSSATEFMTNFASESFYTYYNSKIRPDSTARIIDDPIRNMSIYLTSILPRALTKNFPLSLFIDPAVQVTTYIVRNLAKATAFVSFANHLLLIGFVFIGLALRLRLKYIEDPYEGGSDDYEYYDDDELLSEEEEESRRSRHHHHGHSRHGHHHHHHHGHSRHGRHRGHSRRGEYVDSDDSDRRGRHRDRSVSGQRGAFWLEHY